MDKDTARFEDLKRCAKNCGKMDKGVGNNITCIIDFEC